MTQETFRQQSTKIEKYDSTPEKSVSEVENLNMNSQNTYKALQRSPIKKLTRRSTRKETEID